MRARTVWLLSLPFLLLSETFGHAIAARVPDLGTTRHGLLLRAAVDYREYVPAALAAALVVVGVVLVRRALASFHRAEPRPLPGWRLSAIPAFVFLVQEHVERPAQDGGIGWFTAPEPAVLVGVALQISFGLCALWLARALLRAADQIGCALARRPSSRTGAPITSRHSLFHALPLRPRVLASRHAGRAPPACA
jgi:hypothetical protein